MYFPAHIKFGNDGAECVQTVETHCRNCAAHAKSAAPSHIKQLAYLAGLLHDFGKYTERFRTYLACASRGEPVRRGSVNHTFAGVRFVMARWHKNAPPSLQTLTAEIIAFAVGAHHGQFDCISPEGQNGYQYRLQKEGIDYAEAESNYLKCCAGTQELDRLFSLAEQETAEFITRCNASAADLGEAMFCVSMLARQVLAAVIEGDRRDTAEFISGNLTKNRTVSFAGLLAGVESRLRQMPEKSGLDAVRRKISNACRSRAEGACGIYRLTVPTGGGKTLATLRFALASAAQKGGNVILVIPLLSILEQNAKVWRSFIGDGCAVLEHHSNVVRDQNILDLTPPDISETGIQNWNAPIIITTLVQFLNTLFAGQTSAVRRMAALRNSVIVIDEVQSVPRNMLTLFNLAMNYLAVFCGCTIVHCSATQPCLDRTFHKIRYAADPELYVCSPEDLALFKRTNIIDRRKPAGYSAGELGQFILTCIEENDSLLVVCNTKAEAKSLYISVRESCAVKAFHLSTAMCMAHRRRVLSDIAASLESKEKVVCISTQMVEAGVDFSFGCVIRIAAGLDNVIQAAGRCNRSGEFGRLCPVYIVNLREERLDALPEIRQAQQAAESFLLRYSRHPEIYGEDLTSGASVTAYYSELYKGAKAGSQDYPAGAYGATIYEWLSTNSTGAYRCESQKNYTMHQAFETAGKTFRVFDDSAVDVIVPYEAGAELIADLYSARAAHSLTYRSHLYQKAAEYTVSLFEYQQKHLTACGAVRALECGSVFILDAAYYDGDCGFSMEAPASRFIEL